MKRGWYHSSWFTYLVLAAAGALFPLALAPLFWWPLGLLSIAILFVSLERCDNGRQAFNHTWWYSLGQFGAGVSWVYVSMHDHGGTPAWLAIPMAGGGVCRLLSHLSRLPGWRCASAGWATA